MNPFRFEPLGTGLGRPLGAVPFGPVSAAGAIAARGALPVTILAAVAIPVFAAISLAAIPVPVPAAVPVSLAAVPILATVSVPLAAVAISAVPVLAAVPVPLAAIPVLATVSVLALSRSAILV